MDVPVSPEFAIKQAFVALGTGNLAQLVKFYQVLLSPIQVQPPLQQPGYCEFNLPGLRLGLFQVKRDAEDQDAENQDAEDQDAEDQDAEDQGPEHQHPAPLPYGLSLCLEVPNLEAAILHLRALGYPPSGPILTAAHGREIYGYDPDGNGLILHQGL
jgi:hypothetical protein